MICANMATGEIKNEPKSGYVDVSGIRLHYLDWSGKGAPIVILHATGFLGRIYAPIAAALTAVGQVYSYDQRGHGDSGLAPDGKYDWQRTVEDLAGFIAAMGFKSVRGLGHSAGGTAIGSLASARPELISRAVLIDPVIFETPAGPELGWRNPFIERTLKRKRVFDSVEAMFQNFHNKFPYATWRKEILRDYCEYGTRENSEGKRELKCRPEIEARFYETSREFDGLGHILRCEVPLLVLFGQRGDSPGAMLSDKVAAGLKHGRVVNVTDAGHFIPMEKPGEVSRLAVEFFAE
jgi:pimeloyl-ACP methyl ester carboxylesterase